MAIVLPGDLDVFFDPGGFGEEVHYIPPGGQPIVATAIWHRSAAEESYGAVRLAVERFTLRSDQVGVPVVGGQIEVLASGERFSIRTTPESGTDRLTWLCSVTSA